MDKPLRYTPLLLGLASVIVFFSAGYVLFLQQHDDNQYEGILPIVVWAIILAFLSVLSLLYMRSMSAQSATKKHPKSVLKKKPLSTIEKTSATFSLIVLIPVVVFLLLAALFYSAMSSYQF